MPKLASRKANILSVYTAHGGMMSLPRLTRLCIEEGVWSPHDQETMIYQAANKQCHEALRTIQPSGLPVAGVTRKEDVDGRMWIQLPLWDYDDATYNLGLRLRQQKKDYERMIILVDYMVQRWGQAPPIPLLVNPPDGNLWWEDDNGHDEDDEEDDDT